MSLRAFSLAELLVVIAVIAVLMAILLPVLSSARRAAYATKCLANLQQWSQALQMYLNDNKGRSPALGVFLSKDGNNPPMWWEALQPYHPEVVKSLFCPEATASDNGIPRSAFAAWGPEAFFTNRENIRGPYSGSYGVNGWLLSPDPNADDDVSWLETLRANTSQASRVPTFFDCARWSTWPKSDDKPLVYKQNLTGSSGFMSFVALERHNKGQHVAFLDGHVEHVDSPTLWTLKWSETFTPSAVVMER